jgi:hypothetical protein
MVLDWDQSRSEGNDMKEDSKESLRNYFEIKRKVCMFTTTSFVALLEEEVTTW